MNGWDDCPKCHGHGGYAVGGLGWSDWRDCWKTPPRNSQAFADLLPGLMGDGIGDREGDLTDYQRGRVDQLECDKAEIVRLRAAIRTHETATRAVLGGSGTLGSINVELWEARRD